MAKVSQKKKELAHAERGVTCEKCFLPFKSISGYRSHFFHKHTDAPTKAQVSTRHEKLAGLVIANATNPRPLNKAQLLELAGYARGTIQKTASQCFTTQAFQEALAKRGFSPEKLLKIYEEAGEAKQGSWFQGEFYQDNAPDHATRLKAASGLADILGIKKRLIESKSVNVNLDSDGLRLMLGLG